LNYKSILQEDTEHCYICGAKATEWHHIFNSYNKKNSEKYGAMVRLCHECHNEPPNGVHHNSEKMKALQKEAQAAIAEQEDWQTPEDVIEAFGFNLLDVCDRCGGIIDVSNHGSYEYGDYFLCDCCYDDLYKI